VESDFVAVEEPLEIRVVHAGRARTLAVTMRTPGNDGDLACGFLFTEGAVKQADDVLRVEVHHQVVEVHLRDELSADWGQFERHVFMSSSCGVCGKTSIESVRQACTIEPTEFQVEARVIRSLPDQLRTAQAAFKSTGGIHAAAWFTPDGQLFDVAEDVGRHNALDQLIGRQLRAGNIPFPPGILLLSGRASFELIQKARLAGISVVAAVGAPSSLAVELAADGNMTLAGFVKADRLNVYAGAHRIPLEPTSA